MKFYQFDYIVVTVACLTTAILFFRTKNGMLRKLLVGYFLAEAFRCTMGLYIVTNHETNDMNVTIALFPEFIFMTLLCIHLLRLTITK